MKLKLYIYLFFAITIFTGVLSFTAKVLSVCFVCFVDVIDVVKDQLHGADYLREEDPRVYMSEKTGRGPLTENWVEEYWDECKVTLALLYEAS